MYQQKTQWKINPRGEKNVINESKKNYIWQRYKKIYEDKIIIIKKCRSVADMKRNVISRGLNIKTEYLWQYERGCVTPRISYNLVCRFVVSLICIIITCSYIIYIYTYKCANVCGKVYSEYALPDSSRRHTRREFACNDTQESLSGW